MGKSLGDIQVWPCDQDSASVPMCLFYLFVCFVFVYCCFFLLRLR